MSSLLAHEGRRTACIAVHNAPPPDILPAVRSFLKLFYSHMYGIPMKWEPDGDSITWCEGSPSNKGSLVLKGVPHQPLLPDSICFCMLALCCSKGVHHPCQRLCLQLPLLHPFGPNSVAVLNNCTLLLLVIF